MKRWLIGFIVLALIGAGSYAAYIMGLFNRSAPADDSQADAAAELVTNTNAASGADALAADARVEADGPCTQEIAVAQAALSAAQARYDRLAGAGLSGSIAAAEAALAGSQASLAKVLEGASDQQLIVAEAEIANARAALEQAQSAYNLVKWRNDIGALPESARLEQATINYEAAQARLDDLTRGTSQADISGASAQVRGSQAQLEELRTGMPSDLAAADADVRAAQAQLDLLRAGTRPEIIR